MNLVVAIFGTLHKAPPFYDVFVVLGFLIAVLWIGVTANEVVGLLSSLGVFWNIPSTIMGLTFLAWANSIGDLVADVSLSRIGKARTAVSFLYPGFAGRLDSSCPCETEQNITKIVLRLQRASELHF